MGRKVLIVIDVQNCFLKGGSLPVDGGDTPDKFVNKINQLITKGGFTDVFLTQDVHHPENVSMMNLNMHTNMSNKTKYGTIPSGLPLRLGLYTEAEGYKMVQKRRWGGDLTAQVLWPRHCIISPDDPYFPKDYTGQKGQNMVGDAYGSDLAFELNAYKDESNAFYSIPSHATIYHVYKGFDQKKDSYSAIADAVGEEDPFIARVNGKSQLNISGTNNKFTKVLSQLNTEGISDIYICGIATDFCVYQSTMDLIDLWIFSQKGEQQNKPKIHLIYDLTRGVIPPGIPGHKSEGDYYREAFKLLKDVNAPGCVADYFQVDLYNEVVKELTGENVPRAPVQNNNNYTGAFTAMFGETANLETSNNTTGGRRRNKSRRNHKRGCNCKSCWPKMKGGKRKGTRKPAGHKKGCKCVVCKR
jgi:nicotinamidase-related amidase